MAILAEAPCFACDLLSQPQADQTYNEQVFQMKLREYVGGIMTFFAYSGLLLSVFVTGVAEAKQEKAADTISAFDSWLKQYCDETSSAKRKLMLNDGVEIAQRRRDVLLELIKSDPAEALRNSIAGSVRRQMPPQIAEQLETRISGVGDYLIYCVDPSPAQPSLQQIQRFVRINGATYRASVYGRRVWQTTKYNIPLDGLALDGWLALDDKVLHELTPDEASDRQRQIFDLQDSGQNTSTGVLASAADTIYHFSSVERFRAVEARLECAEMGVGPICAIQNIIYSDKTAVAKTPQTPAPSTWTTGLKKVLIIRVDFSDLAGDPAGLTASDVQSIADTQIAPYYLASSYRLTSLSNTVTPVYRMPQTAAYYATNYATTQLFTDAEDVAGVNYNSSQFDRVIVFFSSMTFLPGSQINWGGLSGVGAGQVWVNGIFNFDIVAHELGHTYGLFHANLWQVSNGDPVSSGGTSAEYHDDFDTMGGNYANDLRTDFNPWFKNMLGWIGTNQIQAVTTNGTFRINRFDSGFSNSNGILALKIVKDSTHNYWVGYRGNFTNNNSLQNGAYVIWGYNNNRQSDLLDTATPGVSDQDAGLTVGSSLIDPAANISITTVAKGTSGNTQYLDIKVHYGSTLPAIYTQPRSTTATAGQSILFQVQGSGIPLPNYRWQRKPAGSSTWTNVNDGTTYAGATTPSLTTSLVAESMNTDQFQCILSNSSGSITTAPPAVLTVIPIGVSTLAGLARTSGSADGLGSAARFIFPSALVVDGTGTVYVSDRNNDTIRKITPAGAVTTIAGLARNAGYADGTNGSAQFNFPMGICMDSAGNLYVADLNNHVIRKMSPSGANWIVTRFAGQPGIPGNSDGPAATALFKQPVGIAIDPLTNFFVAEAGNKSVRRISLSGTNWSVQTLATGFTDPEGICVDRSGNVFVADTQAQKIKKILPAGQVITVAGTGVRGAGDGPGSSAIFADPVGIAADLLGNLYIADTGNNTIRRLDLSGMVSTVAGQAGVAGSNDSSLTNSTFNIPWGLTTDLTGNVYVADYFNDTVRKIVLGPPMSLPRIDGVVCDTNVFRFVVDGSPGTNYVIQTSSDLTNWLALSTNVISNGGWTTIQDPLIPTQPIKFYRTTTQTTNGLSNY